MDEIKAKQQEAFSAYEMYYARDLIADEANKFAALQAGMLAEIALQLQKQNEALGHIADMLHIIADKK